MIAVVPKEYGPDYSDRCRRFTRDSNARASVEDRCGTCVSEGSCLFAEIMLLLDVMWSNSDGYSGYFFGENWANDLISNNNVCGYRDFATADSRAEDLLEGGRISRSAQTAIWRSSRRGRRRNSMCFIW